MQSSTGMKMLPRPKTAREQSSLYSAWHEACSNNIASGYTQGIISHMLKETCSQSSQSIALFTRKWATTIFMSPNIVEGKRQQQQKLLGKVQA